MLRGHNIGTVLHIIWGSGEMMSDIEYRKNS